MPHRILVTATNFSGTCPDAFRLLTQAGLEVVENPHQRPMTLTELSPVVASVSGVMAGVDTWNESVFRIAPNLRVICRFGVGVDNFDIPAATRYGIAMCNCPGANANAVAELVVGLMLALGRQIPLLDSSTRRGAWARTVGVELHGKTIGLVGLGRIARLVVPKVRGFGMKVVAHDPYVWDEQFARENEITRLSFDELLRESDYVSLHAPVTADTRHIMDTRAFGLMRPTAVLINTARGALVDEAALYDALSSGRLARAGLDVYEEEPARNNRLFELENVVVTPHTGAETREAINSVSMMCAQSVVDVLSGRRPVSLLNPEAWDTVMKSLREGR